jgi:hypothetical protein
LIAFSRTLGFVGIASPYLLLTRRVWQMCRILKCLEVPPDLAG